MQFGQHVDGAVRTHARSGLRIRTDISATLFLRQPQDYDGGELLVEDTYGVHNVKLPAGDMVLYPATSLHRVDAGDPRYAHRHRSSGFKAWSATMRNVRCCSTSTWRSCGLTRDVTEHAALVSLTGCYHNLLRMWAEP